MKKSIVIALGFCLVAAASVAQQLRPHTEFRVKLTGPLSTASNQKGDKLAAQVISPKLFAGSTLEGQITECKAKGLLRRSSALTFTFKSLHTRKREIAISSDVKSFGNSLGKSNVDEQGAEVERTSEPAANEPNAIGGAVQEAGNQIKNTTGSGARSIASFLVQMTSKEKHINFAPGAEFVLDVSPAEEPAEAKPLKKQ